jgi:hypothetical protein
MLVSTPPASPADKALVQKCPAAQGKDVASYEAEIDAIVARLYSLTDAERQVIEGRDG